MREETASILEAKDAEIDTLQSDLIEALFQRDQDQMALAEAQNHASALQEQNIWLWKQVGAAKADHPGFQLAPAKEGITA